MKILDRIVMVVFVLCLLFSAIVWPVVIMMTKDTYYINQFEKIGTMPEEDSFKDVYYINGDATQTAFFTQKQMKEIVHHISSFINGEKESFALNMDMVLLNGNIQNNVKIFSDTAIEHMLHVRTLYNNVSIAAYVAAGMLIAGAVYMFKRKEHIRKHLFKWSATTVGAIIGIILLFALFVLFKTATGSSGISTSSYLRTMWYYLHYLFFPFSSEQFGGSFFNDTLTDILTIEFFMNTVTTVFVNLVAILSAWLFSAKMIRER